METTPKVAPQIATEKDTPNSMDVGEQRNLLGRWQTLKSPLLKDSKAGVKEPVRGISSRTAAFTISSVVVEQRETGLGRPGCRTVTPAESRPAHTETALTFTRQRRRSCSLISAMGLYRDSGTSFQACPHDPPSLRELVTRRSVRCKRTANFSTFMGKCARLRLSGYSMENYGEY